MRNQTPEQIATLRSFLASQMPHRTADVVYMDEFKEVRRQSLSVQKLSDERAENPHGRYRLVGAISGQQYEAGCRFRNDVAKYRRVLDIRKESQSIAGFGQPQAPTPKDIDDPEARKIMQNYMLAYEAMASRAAQAAVKHVVILEQEIGEAAFRFYSCGLEKLSRHYGLTK